MNVARWLTICFASLLALTPAWSQDESRLLSDMTPAEISELETAVLSQLLTKEKVQNLSDEQQAAVRTVIRRELASPDESKSRINWSRVGILAIALPVGLFLRRWIRSRLFG